MNKSRRNPRLSLDLLRGFRAAAKHLSFTRAAAELSVSQPAISREVRTLEEQLGTPLFRRASRAIQLTQAGEELYRAVDEGLAIIDAATRKVVGAGRTLAVTTSVPFASFWLVPRLPKFTRLYPDINMRVVASNDIMDLSREHIDVAIRYVARDSGTPAGEKLIDYHIFPVSNPELAQDVNNPIRTPADLENHTLIDLETVTNNRPWYDWQQWFDAMNVRSFNPEGLLRLSHFDQVVDAVIKGSGVAIGKWPHLASHLRHGTLVAPLGRQWIATAGSYYVIVSGTADSSAAALFADWLQTEAKLDRDSGFALSDQQSI